MKFCKENEIEKNNLNKWDKIISGVKQLNRHCAH